MQGKAETTFDCRPSSVRDRDASALDHAAAASRDLTLCRHKPIVHKFEQFDREPRKERWIGAAVLS